MTKPMGYLRNNSTSGVVSKPPTTSPNSNT